jgi:hypothetical protein
MSFVRRHWQWMIVSAGAVSAIILAYWGLDEYFASQGQPRPFWDIGYFIIYLFVMESGEAAGLVPWQLSAARWLAAGVAFWAVAKTALVLYHERMQLARPARWRGHVVICGLGKKGICLAKEFQAAGWRVAAIDRNPNNPAMAGCRQAGVIVLVGDATEASVLARAGAPRARYVIAVTGDDGANMATAIKLHQLIRNDGARASSSTTCLVHLVDLPLCELFKQHSIFRPDAENLEVRVFNAYESAARILFAEHPLEGPGRDCSGKTPHLAVLGFGKMGQSVALQAAKIAHYASGIPLRVSIVDRDAARLGNMFLGSYPHYPKICEIEFVSAEIGTAQCLACIQEWAREPDSCVTLAVCLDEESECISAAIRIAAYFRDNPAPLYVRMADTTGLASLFEDAQGLPHWLDNLHPFGMICQTCRMDTVIDGRLDVLAQAIHKAYTEEQINKGRHADDAAMRPWAYLDPAFRDSNRQQADHIPVKLRTIDCLNVGKDKPGTAVKSLGPEDVEMMAKMEHARWNAERFLAGWTLGPRDPERRTSPDLIAWDDLPEHVREQDRVIVRNIPALLDAIGEKIIRTGPRPSLDKQA